MQRRNLNESERRDHVQTLEALGRLVIAIPKTIVLHSRHFVLLSL
ncbi:MAG: hypothetical protein WKG01_20255 [Kofleriaceae bacterium]